MIGTPQTKLRIGVDLDGVLADFNGGLAKILNMSPQFEDLVCWDWPKYFGVTDQELEDAWTRIAENEKYWRTLATLDWQALDLLRRTQDKVEYTFLTSRFGKDCELQSRQWLEARGIRDPLVVVTSNKGLYKYELDAMIDDKPENLMQFKGAPTRLYLVDQPWNRSAYIPCLIRVLDCYAALRQMGVHRVQG